MFKKWFIFSGLINIFLLAFSVYYYFNEEFYFPYIKYGSMMQIKNGGNECSFYGEDKNYSLVMKVFNDNRSGWKRNFVSHIPENTLLISDVVIIIRKGEMVLGSTRDNGQIPIYKRVSEVDINLIRGLCPKK